MSIATQPRFGLQARVALKKQLSKRGIIVDDHVYMQLETHYDIVFDGEDKITFVPESDLLDESLVPAHVIPIYPIKPL